MREASQAVQSARKMLAPGRRWVETNQKRERRFEPAIFRVAADNRLPRQRLPLQESLDGFHVVVEVDADDLESLVVIGLVVLDDVRKFL